MQAEASKEKDKKRKGETSSRKSHGKRTMDDDVNPTSTKRNRDHDGYHGKYNDRSREKEPCSYCRKLTDYRKDKVDTHTTGRYFHKRKADGKPKESNQMEGFASRMDRIERLLEKSAKRSKREQQ